MTVVRQNMKNLWVLAAVMGVMAAAGCKDSPKKVYVCDSGFSLSEADTLCVPDPKVCTKDVAGSIATECADAMRYCIDDPDGASCGACLSGYREEEGKCVAVTNCASLDCASVHKVCSAAGEHQDAACVECEPGTVAVGDACVVPNCGDGSGSMAPACAELFKVCVTDAAGAHCGDCVSGFVSEGGTCVPAVQCAELNCSVYNRECIAATGNAHAQCGECKAGLALVNNACKPVEGAGCGNWGTNLTDQCTAAGRVCVELSGAATCGDCLAGYVADDSAGVCLKEQKCTELDCAVVHRDCSDEPTGHCSDCLPGYVADAASGGQCRPTITCDALTCADDERCAPAGDFRDAFCRKDCGEFALWNGQRCEPCPRCNEAGELGVWPWATAAGNCICETEPGYFYSVGADMGSFPCDKDADGWVRESARIALDSRDLNISQNANCSLRMIDSIRLTNEQAQLKTVALEEPLALYETDKTDDDGILHAIWTAQKQPNYGSSRKILASELNRFTKLCHTAKADYNDNGYPDVEEYGAMDMSPAMSSTQQPFNEYSYFKELYVGRYVPPGPLDQYGSYQIAEKSRLADSSIASVERVPLVFSVEDGEYWRECTLQRDADFEDGSLPPVGMDFAAEDEPENPNWHGMNLHSLFKCVLVDSKTTDGRYQFTQNKLADSGYRVNRCTLKGDALTDPSNPSLTDFNCQWAGISSLELGDVVWAGVTLQEYVYRDEYTRGCVNECVEQIESCTGFVLGDGPSGCMTGNQGGERFMQCGNGPSQCYFEPDNFGKFNRCFAWEICDNLDNNGDGHVDNGNPQGVPIPATAEAVNYECQTGRFGVCAPGHLHCCTDEPFPAYSTEMAARYDLACNSGHFGELVCVPDRMAEAEICDSDDNDCDGEVDNNPLNEGDRCEVPGAVGVCRRGTRVCHGNINMACETSYVPPLIDNQCDTDDNDCDGQVDEDNVDAVSGECPAGFDKYFRDQDSDGAGKLTDYQCRCSAAGEYNLRNVTEANDDCCDVDARAKPGVTTPSADPLPASCLLRYDFNCDGVQTKQEPNGGSSGCGKKGLWPVVWCGSSGSGWVNVPDCGQSASKYSGCTGWSDCQQKTSSGHLQSCL